jgi:hypothetical protein
MECKGSVNEESGGDEAKLIFTCNRKNPPIVSSTGSFISTYYVGQLQTKCKPLVRQDRS